jgi:FMN-dependent NADH-azoreductase
MKKLLHIVASPREDESRTLQIAEAFLKTFKTKHPDWAVEELNLAKEKLPPLSIRRVDGKYALMQGKDLQGELKESWQEILRYIRQFLSADLYLVSTPMWNFSIPYMLKHYIDIIVQPKYLFTYTSKGPEGLAINKKMVILASRGGDYAEGEAKKMDFQEPYLRGVFGFVGIKDITFIAAQPMDMAADLQKERLQEAIEAAEKLAAGIYTPSAVASNK